MRAFITVHLDDGPKPDLAMRQRVTTALAQLGLRTQVDGHKGSVALPRNMYAAVQELEAGTAGAINAGAIQERRRLLSDALSRVLDDLGFRGQFFITVSAQACWGYRPVPRHSAAGKHSDLDALDLSDAPQPSLTES